MSKREAKSSVRGAPHPSLTKTVLAAKAAPGVAAPYLVVKCVYVTCTPQQRRTMIAEAAYFLAEHRGFEGGHELEDWTQAEYQIDDAIARGDLPHVYRL